MGAGGCVVTTIVGSRSQQADIGGTTPGGGGYGAMDAE